MPLYREFGTLVFHWDLRALRKYWPWISNQIIARFGNGPFRERDIVKQLFQYGYEITLLEFQRVTNQQRGLAFYKTVAGLYENTVTVQAHLSKGEHLMYIKEQDFVANRNGLRLILERACELDLQDIGLIADVTEKELETIEDLLYLSTWIWSFSQNVASQMVLGDIQEVIVDPDRTLRIQRKGDWDATIELRRTESIRLGRTAIQDVGAVRELIGAFKHHFGIDYRSNSGFIPAPYGIHPFAEYPLLDDVSFEEMVRTFASKSNVPLESARLFYEGFSLRPENMPGLDQIVRKPGGQARHMYRPILVWNVDGEPRMICGPKRWSESLALIAINALQWREVPPEWLMNHDFNAFVQKKHDLHDAILEDRFESVLKTRHPHYQRNVKALQVAANEHVRIDGKGLGQIDFIFLSHEEQKVYVVDCKYLRPRQDMIGYRSDQSNFEKEYEPTMQRKVDWFRDNLFTVEKHFAFKYPQIDIDISRYTIEGMFLLNTPTMYCYNGRYRADAIVQFEEDLHLRSQIERT